MTENYNDTGARIRNTSTGVAVGVGIGALAGYLLHKQLEEKLNKCTVPQEHDPKIHFGELPPNPFDADLDTRE